MTTDTARKPLPARHPDSSFRPVEDEGGLVVLPGMAEVKVLNPVAIKVYSLLDGTHTAEDIARAITDEFDVPEDVALRDVLAFVDELRDHRMLAGSEPPTGDET